MKYTRMHSMRIGLISQALTHKPHPLMPKQDVKKAFKLVFIPQMMAAVYCCSFASRIINIHHTRNFMYICSLLIATALAMTTLAHAHKISTL
jgi:hypothetical protein